MKSDILELNDSDVSHEAFSRALRNTIDPLYQIALNQGYSVWRCDRTWLRRQS